MSKHKKREKKKKKYSPLEDRMFVMFASDAEFSQALQKAEASRISSKPTK